MQTLFKIFKKRGERMRQRTFDFITLEEYQRIEWLAHLNRLREQIDGRKEYRPPRQVSTQRDNYSLDFADELKRAGQLTGIKNPPYRNWQVPPV